MERSDPAVPERDLPFPASLCHRCAAHRHVRGRATLFVLCTALPLKYPPQPVLRCPAFQPETRAEERGGPAEEPET